MNIYEKELLHLKPYDPVQFSRLHSSGLLFIETAGHGYLVVPTSHPDHLKAVDTNSFGFIGDKAVYLEEDSEMWAFLKKIS